MSNVKDSTKASKSKLLNNKDRRIGLRLCPKEYEVVQAIARRQDRSVSSLVRVCLRIGMQQIQSESEA